MTTRARRGYMPRAGRRDWRTPADVVAIVRQALRGCIDLDPCAGPRTDHGVVNIRRPACGLNQPWAGRVFVNPPFGDLDRWAPKCRREHEEHGCEVVLLLPARTDTLYWQKEVATATAVCFWRGRLRFEGAKASAPFPVVFAYWGAWPWEFYAAFHRKGKVCRP